MLSNNPFEAARLKLVKDLLAIKAPAPISTFPLATDFEEVARHVRECVAVFDDWFETIGFQVQDNSSEGLDMCAFDDAFSRAIEGNGVFLIEECAAAVREGRRAA